MKHLKEEFDKLTLKELLVYSMALISLLAGLALLFMGLLIAPKGEIHSSVLCAFGLISIFVASLLGISIHYANELDKFKANIMEKLGGLAP